MQLLPSLRRSDQHRIQSLFKSGAVSLGNLLMMRYKVFNYVPLRSVCLSSLSGVGSLSGRVFVCTCAVVGVRMVATSDGGRGRVVEERGVLL
jgi:hypothetical protein